MKEIQQTVYAADDGTTFVTRDECEKYEADCRKMEANTKFFVIMDSPDRTETGLMQRKRFAAVYDTHYCQGELIEQFALNENGGRCVGVGVMGYGKLPTFRIVGSSRKEFVEHADDGRIVIADKDFDFLKRFGKYTFVPTEKLIPNYK